MAEERMLLDSLGITGVAQSAFDLGHRYAGIHMGLQNLTIGGLIRVLEDVPPIKAPRSGHVGNWGEIARGCAGPMDFNGAICRGGWGYPLIHGFTQTESTIDASGDHAYLPGSLIENGRRHLLPIHTWDGTRFAERTRERSWFCPFALTEFDGARLPLVQFQLARMPTTAGFEFRTMAHLVESRQPFVKQILSVLLEEAGASANPRSSFQDLISHSVALDGTLQRCVIRRDGPVGYWLDDCYYAGAFDLVDAAMDLYRSVTHPNEFLSEIVCKQARLPVVSNVLNVLLFAYLGADRTEGPAIAELDRNLPIVHLHWGARDMAGFPPHNPGYFTTRSKIHSYRRITKCVNSAIPAAPPVCFVLLPATVFMLCPTQTQPSDSSALAELFDDIMALPTGSEPKVVTSCEQTVLAWKERHWESMSDYYKGRFIPRAGVLPRAGEQGGRTVEPEGFRQLTLRQASIITGALY